MEKVQINNQIISMRKLVKQAKVHVINKLVKEVKLLKAKKGDEAKIAKFQRKAERLLLEINLIKKMNVDAVSKKALTSKKNWKQIVSDKSVSMDERAVARLISFDSVQKEAEQFDSKFPHLVKILPDLIQEWEAKKQNTSPERKKLKAAEIRKVKEEKKRRRSKNRSISVTPDVKQETKQPAEESDVSQDPDESQDCERLAEDEVSDSDLLSGHEKENNVEVRMSIENPDHGDKGASPNVLKNSGHSEKFNHRKQNSQKFKKQPNLKKSFQNNGKPRTKPFAGGLNKKAKKQHDPSPWKGTGANSVPCSPEKRKNLDSDDFTKEKFDGLRNGKNVTSSEQKNSSFKKSSLKNSGKKASASLHPSWEAKRKMNIQVNSILPFQGKKVKFDE